LTIKTFVEKRYLLKVIFGAVLEPILRLWDLQLQRQRFRRAFNMVKENSFAF
jgi:hypothetical protein